MTAAVAPLLDLPSARLATPAVTADNLRLFLWPDRVEAWGLQAGAPWLAFEASVASINMRDIGQPTRDWPWTVTTTGGDLWMIWRGSGCGCSGPLRALRPERE